MLREYLVQQIPVFSGTDIKKILDLAQKSHENYLIRANKKDLDRALIYYLEAIRINPSIPEVYYKLASILWEKGDIDLNSAIKQCKKAVELAPHSSTAKLYLGYFLKASGKYTEAETTFKESIKLGGIKSSKSRLALASTMIEKLKNPDAKIPEMISAFYFLTSGIALSVFDYDVIRMFLKITGENICVYNFKLKAGLCRKLGKFAKTVEIYEKAAAKTERKEMFYSKIGDLFTELQNPDRAAEYYRQALKDSPDNIILWVKLAEILQKHHKNSINEVVECFCNITRLEPSNSRIFYELGHLYLKSENKFNAVNAFKRALEIEPKNAFYHNSLAYALVQLQDYEGAINEYQQAILINPDNEWTSIVAQALGAIYHQIKDNIDAAIVSYQTAVILDKKNIDAYIALGEAYQDKNDIDNAVNCFCEAIKINPSIARIYCNIGLLLWEKGCIEESIVAYQKAVSLNPNYAIAYNNLGVVYLDGNKDPKEAKNMFLLATKHNPNYALAYYNMGRTHEYLENKLEAAKYFQTALDINKFTNEIDEEEVENKIKGLFAV
jgi:superkiller protein 3